MENLRLQPMHLRHRAKMILFTHLIKFNHCMTWSIRPYARPNIRIQSFFTLCPKHPRNLMSDYLEISLCLQLLRIKHWQRPKSHEFSPLYFQQTPLRHSLNC